MNVMQAVQHAQAAIRANNASPDVKAIAYCWLFHLVGDMHQPLHSTALCSVDQFPEGDRGGNEILLVRGKNLHALWDGLLGNGTKLNDVKRSVYELSDRRLYGEAWYSAGKETDVRKWVDESHALCQLFLYSPAILRAVGDTPHGTKMRPLELPVAYMQKAGSIARERVVAAGMRLGVMLGAEPSAFPKLADGDRPARDMGAAALAPLAASRARPSAPAGTAAVQEHWLNIDSNIRHNSSCRYYGKTKSGRACAADEGKPCKLCGG